MTRMSLRPLLLLIAALVLCGTAVTSASAQSAPRMVTLREAVLTALRQNHALAGSRLEVERAEARVREAWGYAFPRIDAAGRYTRALKKPVFFLPDFENPGSGVVQPIEIGSDHAYELGFSASQVLFNSAVFIGVGSAGLYSEAARQYYRAGRVSTVSAVRKAYTGALVAGEYERLTREILANAEENFRNVRALTTAGITSDYDLLRAEVAVENTKPEVLEAAKNARLALNGLRQVMGLSGDEEIAVADSLVYELVPDAALEGIVDSVLRVNPGLRAARLQVEVADAIVGVQRSEFLPSLAAFGSYQWQAQRNQWGISTQDFIASAQVGLTLSMNVFSGLQTNARVEQAQVDMRKAAEQASALELALRTQAEAVVLRLRTARERLQAQDRTVEQARRGYRIATTRYTSGSGTQLEVNDAQVALTRASVNRIQAVYEYIAASADYDELLGRMPDYAMNGSDE